MHMLGAQVVKDSVRTSEQWTVFNQQAVLTTIESLSHSQREKTFFLLGMWFCRSGVQFCFPQCAAVERLADCQLLQPIFQINGFIGTGHGSI